MDKTPTLDEVAKLWSHFLINKNEIPEKTILKDKLYSYTQECINSKLLDNKNYILNIKIKQEWNFNICLIFPYGNILYIDDLIQKKFESYLLNWKINNTKKEMTSLFNLAYYAVDKSLIISDNVPHEIFHFHNEILNVEIIDNLTLKCVTYLIWIGYPICLNKFYKLFKYYYPTNKTEILKLLSILIPNEKWIINSESNFNLRDNFLLKTLYKFFTNQIN